MARGVKAKKKKHTDRTSKYLVSDKQLEKIKRDLSKQLIKDVFILFLAATRDCKGLTVDEVYELAETFMRYAWYDEENILKIKEMKKALEEKFGEEEFGFKFTGI